MCGHQCRSDISIISGWFGGVGLQGSGYDVGSKSWFLNGHPMGGRSNNLGRRWERDLFLIFWGVIFNFHGFLIFLVQPEINRLFSFICF